MTEPKSPVQLPNEADRYRDARNRLLQAEIELRRKIEEVAALRRELPQGGEVKEDYVFEGVPDAKPVRLSELFAAHHDTLILYSFMYSAEMETPCPMCTSYLDSLDGAHPHISSRVSLAIVAKSPPSRIAAHAKNRGWRNLRLVSSQANSYLRDYLGETEDGSQTPIFNVFVRDSNIIRHCSI